MNLQNFQPAARGYLEWLHPTKKIEMTFSPETLSFYLIYYTQTEKRVCGFYKVEDGLKKLYKILPIALQIGEDHV